mgnify:CR=1 FL=1
MSRKRWYVHRKPEAGKAFREFHDECLEKGKLSRKTRELIMAAVASAMRCPHCTENHIKGAMEAGADEEEVTEALMLAALEGAGSQLYWASDLFEEYLGEEAGEE